MSVKKEKNQNLNFEKATLIAELKHPSYYEQHDNITTEKIKNPKDHQLNSLAGNEELNKAEFTDFQSYKPRPEVKIESNDLFNLNIRLQNKPIVFNKDSLIKKWIAGVNNNVFSNKFHSYWSVTGYGNNEWANYNLVNNEAGNAGCSSQAISEDERHEGSYSFDCVLHGNFRVNGD